MQRMQHANQLLSDTSSLLTNQLLDKTLLTLVILVRFLVLWVLWSVSQLLPAILLLTMLQFKLLLAQLVLSAFTLVLQNVSQLLSAHTLIGKLNQLRLSVQSVKQLRTQVQQACKTATHLKNMLNVLQVNSLATAKAYAFPLQQVISYPALAQQRQPRALQDISLR